MIVHQAIYGDQGGAYALLGTSLTDEDEAKRICNVTDVIDRPLTKELTQPIIRGFAYNNYFLFIKSFPDNTNDKIRRGRVFSHAFIIELNELYQLANLEELFSNFLDDINKNTNLKPVIINNNVVTQVINDNTREITVINSLLDEDEKIVWYEEEGYFQFLFKIWSSLFGQLRANLRIGVGFSPKNIDLMNGATNILYIYQGYENKWTSHGYRVLGKRDVESLKTKSSYLLAGHNNKAQKIMEFMDSFKLEPKVIHDLPYIEDHIPFYEGLSARTEFNIILVLCNFISELSPYPSLAITEKRKVFDLILSKIEKASPENIVALNNVKWTGFKNAEKELQAKIYAWSETTLLINTEDSSRSKLVFKSLKPDQKTGWWNKAIYTGLSASLSNWNKSYAISLFEWFLDNPDLVYLLEKYIPNISEIEDSFVACWTKKTPPKVATPLLQLAKKRGWFSLFGLASLQLFDPEKSINELLKIDTNPNHLTALKKTAQFINDKDFIELTINSGEKRLLKIAGGIIVTQPSFLDQLEVTNKVWQEIWLIAIKKGCDPWKNVKEPVKKLYSLFDQALSGNSIALNLIHELNNHKHRDLSGFERRKEVWPQLTGNVKSNFLKATTVGCIGLYNTGEIEVIDLEDEILKQITDFEFFKTIIKNTSVLVSKKIQLFKSIPGLEERSFITLLEECTFFSTESQNIGQLVLKRGWKSTAKYISEQKYSRKDFESAYKECQSLVASDVGLLGIPFSFFHPNREPIQPYIENKGATSEMPIKTKILLLATNPKNTDTLRLDEEFREIEESIKIGNNSRYFKIDKAGAIRAKDLRRKILNTNPNIIHFSGHASPDGIALENEDGNSRLITGVTLANLFKLSEDLNCVILNACYSKSQAIEIAQFIPYVIGMKIKVGDKAAIEFSKGFYDALSSGKDIVKAFEYGKSAIEMEGINEKNTPILIKKIV